MLKTKIFPEWLKRPLPLTSLDSMNKLLRSRSINTVCRSARCPNIGECFNQRQATFMILGNVCTRDCRFCAIKSGRPCMPDEHEPKEIAAVVSQLSLKYVVITSVTRDDLEDGGSSQFAKTIKAVKELKQDIKVEVLAPDFSGNDSAIETVLAAHPDVFAHNIETVPRLYRTVRPQADYRLSLSVLKKAKKMSDIFLKSSIILGLGETEKEAIKTMQDLRDTGCNFLTIGQYLQPSPESVSVYEFIKPEKFNYYKEIALNIGFEAVTSGPFVRSSYKASQMYEYAKEALYGVKT